MNDTGGSMNLSVAKHAAIDAEIQRIRETARDNSLIGKIAARKYLEAAKGIDRTTAEALLKTLPATMIECSGVDLPHYAPADLDAA